MGGGPAKKCNEVGNKEGDVVRRGGGRKKNNNTNNPALPWRGVYLRFEDLNASALVPGEPLEVFMPLTLSLTSAEQAALPVLPHSRPLLHVMQCNACSSSCGFTFRFALF